MSKIQVDDSAPAISYSGSWQTSSDSRQLGGTSHYTTQSGASATIVFTGSTIRVGCTNPAVPDGVIRAEFVLDGKVNSFTRTSHSNAYYNDQFFYAGGLQRDQQHTLVVRNTGTQVPLHLDSFEIQDGNVVSSGPVVNPPPPPPPTPTSRPPDPPSTTATRTVVRVVSSVEVVTRTTDPLPPASSSNTDASSTGSNSSSTFAAVSSASNSRNGRESVSGSSLPTSISETGSGNAVVTAFQIVTTSVSGVAVVTTISPGDGHGSNQSQALSVGAIVGIIVGCLCFLAIIGILVILLLRNRRKEERRRSLARERMAGYNATPYMRDVDRHDNDAENQSTEGGSSDLHPPPRLSLDFMRTLNEKSRQPVNPDRLQGDLAPATASTPNNPSAPSFRSSYPLSLPDAAPPAYTARLSVAASSRGPVAQSPV